MELVTPQKLLVEDDNLGIREISKTPNPQQIVWLGMRQCYSSDPVWKAYEEERIPSEQRCGELVVERLLKGGKGHWSPIEHAKFVLNVWGFPHSVMQQLRTHRTGVSFSVESGRYTGDSFERVAKSSGEDDEMELLEQAYYLRPVGKYHSRDGKTYGYTEEEREDDVIECIKTCHDYNNELSKGQAEEHARRKLRWDIVRQNFIFSGNARSLMHIMDLRSKKDAQLEIQALAWAFYYFFRQWMPEVAKYYEGTRLQKAQLAP